MLALLALALACTVSPSLGSIDCGNGDLKLLRCTDYKAYWGDRKMRTCAYTNGDSSNEYDCYLTPAICACKLGEYLETASGKKCLQQCDTTPPDLTCSDISANAPDDGVDVNVDFDDITCTDNSENAYLECVPGSGVTVTLGASKDVACWCVDGSGNTADCSFTVTVVDVTDPKVTCPVDMNLAARPDSDNTAATYAATCTDNSGKIDQLSCSPQSGAVFAIGESSVTCTCTDPDGNADTCSFTVTVSDDTPPELDSKDIVVWAPADSDRLPVDFDEYVTCEDAVDSEPEVGCNPTSGSVFSVGEQEVECSCRDDAGNEDQSSFTVTVNDDTPPELDSKDIVVWAPADSDRLPVYFDDVTCEDAVDNEPEVGCNPTSGSVFSVGEEEVECSCLDDAGNKDQSSFTVTVNDDEDPVITCPDSFEITSDQDGTATPANGAATCTDNADANPTVTCVPDSVGTISIGEQTVVCTCEDDAGNDDECEYTITVTPNPDLVCTPTNENINFNFDVDDPEPVAISGELTLPWEGKYRITITAEPIDGTQGDDLECSYTTTVTY